MAVPRYQEIRDKILEEVKNKPVNSTIPSERELAKIFHASRMTVRNAVNTLVEEGVLYRSGNKGTFIADHSLVKRNTSMDNLLHAKEQHFILIHLNIKQIPDVAEIFQISASRQILRIVRLNKKQNHPSSIEEFFFIYEDVEQEYLKHLEQLLDVNYYIQKGKMTQKFYPMMVPIKYANLLNLKLDTPIIMVESTIYKQEGGIKLLTRAYHNPKENPIEITF